MISETKSVDHFFALFRGHFSTKFYPLFFVHRLAQMSTDS